MFIYNLFSAETCAPEMRNRHASFGLIRLERVTTEGNRAVTKEELEETYREYIACLNARDWQRLGTFVHPHAHHNGRSFGVAGYRAMLENDYREIPDLQFNIDLLVADPPYIAARLAFDCTPAGTFLGLPVNGRRVAFAENVFYRFEDGKVREVWSVVDKAAIEAQLGT
jgi:predicted ester cyclase